MEKIRIALAEDHTIVRKGIISMLDPDEGFQVVADAANGAELILKLEKLKVPADVCLLDVNMPKMNGYATLVNLKKSYPDMRFLILTQLEHELIVIKMLKAGASGYLLKDTEPAELKQAIRSVMHCPFYNSSLVDGHIISLVIKRKDYSKLVLNDREQEFLKHCSSELPYKGIAVIMGITERTAAFYRHSLFEKLQVSSRTGLALYALKLGLSTLE